MLDLHCHILPGVDDGPDEWEEALEMAKFAVEDGITGVVCTPHCVPGMFENTRVTVMAAFNAFREKLREMNIPLEIYPGMELRLDTDLLPRIKSGELLSINDMGVFALIELPTDAIPSGLEDFLWELQAEEITPIIAHPERNLPLQGHPERLYEIVRTGVMLQLTAASLLGKFGKEAKAFSVKLLKHRMVHVIATDAHSASFRRPILSEAHAAVRKMSGEEAAEQLLSETPASIVQGRRPSSLPEPISFQKKTFFDFHFLKNIFRGTGDP